MYKVKDKKTAICEAVFSLLDQGDISKITVSMIAEEANIGKGTLYEYFDSKEDIFCFAVENKLDFFMKELSSNLQETEVPFKEVIKNLIDVNVEIFKNNRAFFNLLSNPPEFLLKNTQKKDQNQRKFLCFKMEMHSMIEKILDNAINKGEIKKKDMLRQTLFLPMLISFLLRTTKTGFWQDIPEDIDLEKEKEEFYNIVLDLFS